ncbi:MAG: hypothetical protein ACFFG0_35840 [Candidatus Thorarchaeota archaeon]
MMAEKDGTKILYELYNKINDNKKIQWEKNQFRIQLFYMIIISLSLILMLIFLTSYFIFNDIQELVISGEYVFSIFFLIIVAVVFIISIWTYPESPIAIGFSLSGFYIKFKKGNFTKNKYKYYFIKWKNIKEIKHALVPRFYGDDPSATFDLNEKELKNPFYSGLLIMGTNDLKFSIFFVSRLLLERIIIKTRVFGKK